MDWYLPNESGPASQLRREISLYLHRHAEEKSDFLGAELICSELITNAIENSDSDVWVSLDWGARNPVLTVHDLGSGFELPETVVMPASGESDGRGLAIVTHLTEHLTVAAKSAGGTRVSASLPVARPPSSSIDPEPLPVERLLPTADEADSEGWFGREEFLRALVVQLAQVVDSEAGPGAAETMVASVGSGVGAQIESSYRVRREGREGFEGALDATQIADLLVELKRHIDGDFFLIEADERRIVLGNRRCPFGHAVRHAPALCRMTSSVFGGIASRNLGGAAVHLQERIAVGDPECRVTVWLQQPPEEIEAEVHFYGRMRPADG